MPLRRPGLRVARILWKLHREMTRRRARDQGGDGDGLCIHGGPECDRGGDALGAARAAIHAVRAAEPDGANLPGAPGGQLPDLLRPQGQGRDADAGRSCTTGSTQAANLFRSLGIGETDVVAYVLPNCNETVVTLLGGMVAGIVNPINPLLEPEQIGAILRETKAQGRGHAEGLSQDRRGPEGGRGGAPRAGRPDRARGRSGPLPHAAEILDRAADPAQEPRIDHMPM